MPGLMCSLPMYGLCLNFVSINKLKCESICLSSIGEIYVHNPSFWGTIKYYQQYVNYKKARLETVEESDGWSNMILNWENGPVKIKIETSSESRR